MRLRDQKSMMAKRLKGHLPVIDICGQAFFIDIRAQQLRSVADYGKFLPFYLMQPDPMTHGRRFLYDPDARELFDPLGWDSGMLGYHDHLVWVHLPMDLQMDPIGVARMNGYDVDLALKMCPLQRELKAVVTELESGFGLGLGLSVDREAGIYGIDLMMAGMGRSRNGARNCFAKERNCSKGKGNADAETRDLGGRCCCKCCGKQV